MGLAVGCGPKISLSMCQGSFGGVSVHEQGHGRIRLDVRPVAGRATTCKDDVPGS
jgi:hypothetical protein